MKKFQFSLNKVLNYKEQVEQKLRSEYAQITQRIAMEEATFRSIEEEHAACVRKYENEKSSGSTASHFMMYEKYLDSLLLKMNQSQQRLDELNIRLEEKRQEVITAKTETSSIDKLKSKRQKEYDAYAAKEEEKFIEEFVSNMSSKSSSL